MLHTPVVLAIAFAVFMAALIVGTPRTRAILGVGFRMRREKREKRRTRRAESRNADAYHNALRERGGKDAAADLRVLLGDSPVSSCDPKRIAIDERTWDDLDLEQVFAELDHTRSRPGQQYLRHLLRSPASTAAPIIELNRDIALLEADTDAASAVKDALSLTDDRRAEFLVNLIFGQLPERPAFWFLFPLLSLSAIGFGAATIFWPRALLALIAVAGINIVAQLYYRRRVDALIPAIHEVPAFLKTARTLSQIRTDVFPRQREILGAGARQLKVIQSATSWLKFEPSEETNQLLASLYLYVNLLLLLDVNAFVFALNSAKRSRATMQVMFEAMGYIDAVQSIATWRNTLSHWTAPEFTSETKELRSTALVHPLVKHAVPNNITINDTSALITGSNMSGKTTFIRAIGVNAILAQSLGTVVATSWQAPLLVVSSSIGRSDSVLEGKSYYLAEVESVRTLIQQKGDGRQHLFLIDELFRGTNTAERVAGAYAVLEYLNRGNDIVIVATHDTELLGMLGATYAAHHFREEISDSTLTFDFTLRDGQATTRNAIALLELMQYPAEVVALARRVLR